MIKFAVRYKSINDSILIIRLFSVVGDKEKTTDSVNVRTRDNIVHGVFKIDEMISRFEKLKRLKSPDSDKEF